MIKSIVLGIIQGITEWLPVSSEGILVLSQISFFNINLEISEIIHYSLFLHLGTFFSALIYFRKDVCDIFKALFNYKNVNEETKKLLNFYIIATASTGIVGFFILRFIKSLDGNLTLTGKSLSLLIGAMLLITAYLQIKRKTKERYKKISDLKKRDGMLLGIVQGLSVVPGLSRSGITVSTFLFRKFDDTVALELSFLMSLPVVLVGNIIFNWNYFYLTINTGIGVLISFVLGFFTIHFLLNIAKKVKFGWFVLIFGILTVASVFL